MQPRCDVPRSAVLFAWALALPVALAAQPPVAQPDAASTQGSPETPPVEFSSPYDAFDAGAYPQALDGFVDRQTERPDDPDLSLNVGAAHYKLNDFASADAQFYRAAAIGDDELRAQALYNLGNSAYRQGKLGDAIDFYMASLEANPDDVDTKFNLEFVREQLKKQQQEQNQSGQDQEQESQEGAEQQPEDSDQGGGEHPEDQQGDHGTQDQDQDQDQSEGEEPEDGDGSDDSDRDGDGIPDTEDAPPEGDGRDPANQGGPQEQPPGMTAEEAERYLQALEEGRLDPNRRGQRGRNSRQAKDW